MQSVDVMVVGGLIRFVQGFAQAAPTLLVGLLIASVLRYYLGNTGTRRLFGGDRWRSLPQSWLVGMLLPVCSIGVLPVLFEMRRARVKPGAMSAFALSAPLFNPLSLLYGLTLSRPLVIILFAAGSLVVVTTLGLVWDSLWLRTSEDYSNPNDDDANADSASNDYLIGLRRLAASFVHFVRRATGTPMLAAVVALMGLVFLAAVLPFGAMQTSVERDDWFAPVKMLLVAIPVYASPMLAMSQLGMMFQHANSPGASFTLLIMGGGMNLATPLWFARHYGWKTAIRWFGSLLLIVMAISYAINGPLVPPGVEPAGHTHAFDIYANPVSPIQAVDVSTVVDLVSKEFNLSVVASLCTLAVVMLCGLIIRLVGVDESTLVETADANSFASSLANEAPQDRRGWDVIVPPAALGVALLSCLVLLSVVACYAYYPSPAECLEEVRIARVECLSAANTGQIEHALFWLPVWEDWSRRMEVGTFIRRGSVRPYQRMQGYLIRKKLEALEHELEHDPFELDETVKVVSDLRRSNKRWVDAFRQTP